jgi:hypothetical protein
MMNLLGLALIGVYVGGIWKFLSGFRHTNFNHDASRFYLALLWPALVLTNKSYRRNFNRALKGGD